MFMFSSQSFKANMLIKGYVNYKDCNTGLMF